MLDLDARVHLDEVRLVLRVNEKLERADVAVAEAHRRVDGEARDLLAQALADRRGGRLLDHLLVPALDGALALAEADPPPRRVDRDLGLHVTHALEAPLDVEAVVPERRLRLRGRLWPEALQLARRGRLAHAPSAAAGLGLEHHRVPDRLGDTQRLGHVPHLTVRPRDDRQADLLHREARRGLVVKAREHVGRRANEDEAMRLAHLGEIRALGDEPVARMDRLRAGEERGRDDRGDVQIRLARVRGADADRLVRQVDRKAVGVRFAVDRHRLDVELA